MKRLTTPTHKFILDVDPREWDAFRITYRQAGRIVLEKTQSDDLDMTAVGTDPPSYVIRVRLTQRETEDFRPNIKVEMQIRCHYPDGAAFASDIMTMSVQDVLNQEILGYED